MPQIPAEYIPTVQPGQPIEGRIAPNTIDRASPENFGGQVGQALNQGGNELAQNALQRQQLINEAHVNDVYANQFSPQLQTLRQNYMKLEGKDAEDQFPAYQAQVQGLMTDTRASFQSPMAQKLFDEQAIRRTERELDTMSNYAAVQTKQYQWTSHTAMIDNLVNDSAANFNQPQILQDNATKSDQLTIDYFSKHGYDPNTPEGAAVIKAQMNQNAAKLWSGVIERYATSGDITSASKLLDIKTKDGTLPGDAQLKLQEKLKPQMEMLQSTAAMGRVTGSAVGQTIGMKAQQQGMDPNLAVTVWSAEGGVINPATKNPTSSATGHFQIIDSTWKDLGGTDQDRFDSGRQIDLGLQNIKQATSALTKDLGQQPQPWQVYLAHQQGIAGATALLHADPNASAASVVGNPDAITLNMPGATKDTTVAQFNNFIQGYVQKHATMYDPNGLPTAQNIRDNFQQHVDGLRQQAQIDNPNDPTLGDKYVNNYVQKTATVLHADQMTDQADRDTIKKALSGPNGFKSMDEALANPQFKNAYAATIQRDPGAVYTAQNMANANAANMWDPPATAETDARYRQLDGLRFGKKEEREAFKNMDLDPYYGAMPVAQWNDLVKSQNPMRLAGAKQAEQSVSITHAQTIVAPLLRQAAMDEQSRFYGVDKDPYSVAATSATGYDPQKAAGKYTAYLSELNANVQNWRDNNGGKKPSDAEIYKIGQDMIFPGGMPQQKPAQSPTAEQPSIGGVMSWLKDKFSGGETKSAQAGTTEAAKPDPAIEGRIKELSDKYKPEEIAGFLKAKKIDPTIYGLPK